MKGMGKILTWDKLVNRLGYIYIHAGTINGVDIPNTYELMFSTDASPKVGEYQIVVNVEEH